MNETVHADLADEAQAWAAVNAPPPPPPAATPPASSSSSSSSSTTSTAAAAAPAAEPEKPAAPPSKEKLDLASKLSALAWGIIDTFVPKQLGPRMKLTPDERAELIGLSTPVIAKRLPDDADGENTEEELLLMGAALIYGPKYLSAEPKPDKLATPAGGGEQSSGDNSATSPPTKTTEASIDGKTVTAEVT